MGIEDTSADIPMTTKELREGIATLLKRLRHRRHKPDQRRKRKHQKRKLKREAGK